MSNDLRVILRANTLSSGLLWVGRAFLLVPEAALIPTFICGYLILHRPPLIAFLTALVVIGFMVRAAALYLARASMEQARYGDADAFIQIALLYPLSADALALRGALAVAANDPGRAEVALRRAIELLPGQPAFHAALSSALLDLHRAAEAEAEARLALHLNERYALAHLYLAEAQHAQNAPAQQVEERLRAGLEVAQDVSTTAALQCALAGYLLSEQRVAEATLALQSVEASLPRCSVSRQAELCYHLGELCAAQGHTERAREHFQGAESIDPCGRYAAAAWRASRL